MNCATVRDLLSERLDGPLAASDERAVALHLAACAACRDVDHGLARLVEDLALLSDAGLPKGLAERVVARVPSPRTLRREPHELRRVVGWAAVMVMASLALLGRDFTGQLADNLAPVIARARQEAARSRLSGTSLLGGLDQRAELGIQRMAANVRGSKE